uniref:Uncharacterized protein n=1 Tax=Amphora coffeiformis TaxID=265554 RepID=A0A7S3L7E6_9STRA|mmetsp:Transcript_13912/g.26676  ORF Transcript_13912/g.26676 Transcript_13912/m.26676 type:complete len:394 (-) Transcript_13912:12-1193(-)
MRQRDQTRSSVAFLQRKLKLYYVASGFIFIFFLFNSASLYKASRSSVGDAHEKSEDRPLICYSDTCIEAQAAKLARVWTPRPLHHWCLSSSENESAETNDDNVTTGLWLIKVPKSASSTVAGLVLRIAELHRCSMRWQHAKAVDVLSAPHNRSQTFSIAPIRHPHARTLSSVYYHTVSLRSRPLDGGKPADSHVIRQLDRVENNYISDYTRVSTESLDPRQTVREILQHYDFLLVVEDMEASLVVFAWLADLSLSDVLIMSSKSSGSWYATGRKCVPLIPPQVTPAVEEYWKTKGLTLHYTDRLLHAAARQSLEQTIEQGMGRALFTERLQAFRQLQAAVQDACAATMNESAPCSPTGVYQPEKAKEACYLRDFGCGHRCVNEAVQKYNLASE